jgi:hypothetical protein
MAVRSFRFDSDMCDSVILNSVTSSISRNKEAALSLQTSFFGLCKILGVTQHYAEIEHDRTRRLEHNGGCCSLGVAGDFRM